MSRTITISSWSAAKVTSRWSAGFSPKPAKSSSYILATRCGVLTQAVAGRVLAEGVQELEDGSLDALGVDAHGISSVRIGPVAYDRAPA